MNAFLINPYGYGAAGISMPATAGLAYPFLERPWMYNPVFFGFFVSLLIIWGTRSCIVPAGRPERTVLWLHRIPEQVEPPRPVVRKAPLPEKRPQEELKPKPPELMAKKPTRPKPEILKQPEKLPVSGLPKQPLARKESDTFDRKMVFNERRPASVPAQAPAAVEGAGTDRASRPRLGEMAARDFTPLVPADTATKPVQAAPAGDRPKEAAVLMAGRKAIAADPSGDTREPVAPAPARHTGNHRPGVLSPEQPAAIEEAPDSQTAPVAPVNNIKEGEAQVIITGLASNGSARIRNLKRLIYRKAANLPPGDYCCRVKNMDCRLSVAGDKTITITFSRKKIAFDVVSRLERRLPKGVHPCAD